VDDFPFLKKYSAREIVHLALQRKDNIGIAYTYNEPIVWFEFMLDIAKLVKKEGLKNVMVTNGFINPEPLDQILPYMDAFSVDLKAFTEDFYKNFTSSKLEPVLNTLKKIKQSGKHFEITNLVITGSNDKEREFKQMVNWIGDELGEDTVLHISRYFPTYKMTREATSPKTLQRFYETASKKLNYVYMGNIRSEEGQDTYCKNCGRKVISRSGYFTRLTGLDMSGNCVYCKQPVISDYCL